MIDDPTPPAQFNRYSLRDINEYGVRHGKRPFGPWALNFLSQDPRAWNLAYLSHDYEASAVTQDPQFTVLVRRSLQMNVRTGIVNVCEHPCDCVAAYLDLPAPQAVLKIKELRHLARLPLFAAYGPSWLETIEHRSWKVRSPDSVIGAVPEPDLVDLTQAQALLSAIARRSTPSP